MNDVKEGIRQNLSIGYQVLSHYYDEGKKYVDRFKVLEASVVSIPADSNSGLEEVQILTIHSEQSI